MDDSRWNGKFYSPDQKTNKIIKNGTGYIEEYDFKEKLVFQGNYKNGLRYQVKGIEYYKENDYLKFDGTYKEGNYSEGSYYNINGYKEFKGKFIKGLKSKGLLYKQNQFEILFFYGTFIDGKKYYGIQMSISGGFIGEFDENENFYKGKYYKSDFNLLYKKICFERDKLQELYIEDIENNGTLIFEGEFKDGLFYKGKEYGS